MTSAQSKNGDFIGDEHLCLATLNDYDAVMAIDRNVYSGLDYLPSSYTAIVQNRGTSAFVYRKGKRVVS
ncbi:hypothetical protein BaRGS_00029211 [Batillaria attramentaria]|uniref:Uncharacterized protein n=1 Tax=Batillaria attramentaria TaxID=370345 RepID=A0ABD0JXT7_9CAEN